MPTVTYIVIMSANVVVGETGWDMSHKERAQKAVSAIKALKKLTLAQESVQFFINFSPISLLIAQSSHVFGAFFIEQTKTGINDS